MNKLDGWNMALGHIGSQATIASLTENSAEGIALRRFSDSAQDLTLREYAWPFSTKFATLQLIEEDPTTEWAFKYKYPNDCLFMRRIFSGTRQDVNASRVPYILGQDGNTLVLYTDMEDAEIEYTGKVDLVGIWPVDFCVAFGLRLASLIAPSLTKGDPTKLGNRALELYQIHSARAIATNLNEHQKGVEPDDSFTKSRI